MCTAIAQPAGTKTLTIEALEAGWEANPDGGGYAYIDDNGKIVAVHSMDRDSFILQYIADHGTHGEKSPFLIHVRIATHGSVSLANCHPFPVPMNDSPGEMVISHNGIIDKISDAVKGTDLTDTEGLVKYILAGMNDDWLDNEYLVDYIENFIGWSKLCFLTTNPELSKEMYILNEDMGLWKDDVWYSNWSLYPFKSKKRKGKRQYDYSERYSWPGPDGEAFAYYENGVYREGYEGCDFERWLIDPSDRRVLACVLAEATQEEHIEIFNTSIVESDSCAICTGIEQCYCDDLCYRCYEAVHECDCLGKFISLTESFGRTWGDRIVALAESVVDEEKVDGSDMVVPF
jgi:glutamine amidotransferase